MAKVQVKKTAARKSAPTKVAARVKKAVSAVKKRVDARKSPKAKAAPAKPAAKPAAKPVAKPVAKAAAKPAAKPVAKAAPKAVAKSKVVPKVVAKPAAKPAAKAKPAPKAAAPAKPAPKAAVKDAVKTAVKAVKAVAAKAVAKVAPKAAAAPAAARPVAVPKVVEEKKRRRSRLRLTSNGTPAAAWFAQPGEKPRPSSFIPAPPRAEAPSLVAAPPASSDRLIRPEDYAVDSVRTVPVRVDVEQGGGRIYIGINPIEVNLRTGEGIEWDFRYLGGADVTVDEIVIELEKPSPFATTVFRSRKPGTARPHRQISGAAQKAAAGKRVMYTIRAFNAFKTELASTKPAIVVQ
jgi:hypothetical protein